MKSICMTTSCVLATIVLSTQLCMPAMPANSTLQGSVAKTKATTTTEKSFFSRHPKIRSATIGAGVGTAVGAVTGLVSGKGVVRGAAIGAGAGAGIGHIRSSQTMKRHPIVKDVATGTVVGLGLGLSASRGHGKGKKLGQATAVGAAIGLGVGLLKDKLK